MKLFRKQQPVILFATNDPDGTSERLGARAVHFKQVEGYYKGRAEYTFVVDAQDAEVALQEAALQEQDSMLYLDEYRKAFLIDVDTGTMCHSFGTFQQTYRPRDNEDYTYDPFFNQYYVVR